MKKTLSALVVLGIVSISGMQSASAFDWSNLNPAYWGHCPKCEKKTKKCDPCRKAEPPCQTGAAAPCDPCGHEVTQPKPCNPCDRLQEMNK